MNEYNGWTNYATWAVIVWIDASEELTSQCEELTAESWQGAYKLGEQIKIVIKGHAVDFTAEGMTIDLVEFALELVDWEQIALRMLQDRE